MALLWPCAAAPRLAFQDSGRAAAALAPAEAWFRAGGIVLRPWFTGQESIFALGEEHPTVVANDAFLPVRGSASLGVGVLRSSGGSELEAADMTASDHAFAVLDFASAQRSDQGQVQLANDRVCSGQPMEYAVMRDDFQFAG